MSYGMSETTSIAETPFPPDRAPAGSVGRPATLEVAVADETGRRLAVGETGEILVRGVEVMAGYEDNDEANRQAFFDGWFRTGDAGWIDRDGYVFLSGRLKDILNRGGTKIGPAEVENALTGHPQVAEAAVFGLPHPTLGEDLAAAIVFRPGATVGEPELRAFLRARLPAFKVPAVIFGLVQLPRGSLDKVNRNELVRIAERQLRPDFAAPAAGLETEVAGLFTTALGIPRVSRTDNFFHLGGDSLRGVRVVAGVEEAFGVSVPLDLLFDHPTVASFAAQIEALMGAANRPGA